MNDVLHEIRFIPGVIGSFVYLDQQGVVATDLPERYPVPALRQAGRVVSRLFQVHGMSCMGVSSVDIAFDEVSLSARKVQDQASIITLGDATVNNEFVAMTLGSMRAEIQAALDRIKAADEAPASPPFSAPPQPATRPTATEQTPPAAAAPVQAGAGANSPGLEVPKQTMEQLQACLAKALGPIASLIIGDTLATFQQEPGSTPQDLIERLAGEIDDAELRQTFLHEGKQVVSHLVADREGATGTNRTSATAPDQAAGLPGPLLAQVEASLAKAIGPISQLILGDALAAWQQRGPATQARFGELVEDLCREIGDASAATGFRKEMERALQA